MPRAEKGILGVKKDPKQQMLFSFAVRQGEEWPSDDSEDSDYSPEDVDNRETPRKRKTGKAKTRKRVRKVNSSSSEEDSNVSSPPTKRSKDANKQIKGKQEAHLENNGDKWGQGLPEIVLLKIFKCVVDEDGAVPFLCRVSKVNSLWNAVASDPSLWHKVDLSFGWIKTTERTLRYLCSKRLHSTRELNLSMWKKLTYDGVEMIAQNCQHLRSLNLSFCNKLNGKATLHIADNCPHLNSINLSSTSSDATAGTKVSHLIAQLGKNLQSLFLSGNTMSGFNHTLNALCNHSPNLQLLEVCNAKFLSDFVSIDIEVLQNGCPKLRILNLTNSKFRASTSITRTSDGFPDLEVLSVAFHSANPGVSAMDNSFITRILKSSFNLKSLDLRGSTSISCSSIASVVATDLQHLYLSKSSVAKSADIGLVMRKWRHSLLDVDLSWITSPSEAVDLALIELCSGPNPSPLESLDVAGSSVSYEALSHVLRGCKHLKKLDLTSCRDLPRGMKRKCTNAELKKLQRECCKK